MQAFTPYVDNAELATADLNELLRLTAKARIVAQLWGDVLASAIAQALGGNK